MNSGHSVRDPLVCLKLALLAAVLACLALYTEAVHAQSASSTRCRVDVHLYNGDVSPGAPLARWYKEIGITDVWLYPVQGAFPQDQKPESQMCAEDLDRAGTLSSYRENAIRYWWFERPVPDFLYVTSKSADSDKRDIWDDSAETDALWNGICRKVTEIYPKARDAGFSGFVYDNEAYYSFKGDEKGEKEPWIWAGHEDEYGEQGGYYRRGKQVGAAINAACPGAKVIMAYAFGYPGERWWCQGFKDAGVDLYLGPEHTYGAGPGDLGKDWYQSWWNGKKTKETCDWKRTQFPFVSDNQHVIAGLWPIDFGTGIPNYRSQYFREQLESAANGDPDGPISVWIWPQGTLNPVTLKAVKCADGDSTQKYLDALRDFSRGCDGR